MRGTGWWCVVVVLRPHAVLSTSRPIPPRGCTTLHHHAVARGRTSTWFSVGVTTRRNPNATLCGPWCGGAQLRARIVVDFCSPSCGPVAHVTVSTLYSESSDRSSNPRGTSCSVAQACDQRPDACVVATRLDGAAWIKCTGCLARYPH